MILVVLYGQETDFLHMKHLLFCDTYSMHIQDCNHNAADRRAMYQTFEDDIISHDFQARFEAQKKRYEEIKANFNKDGYYGSTHPILFANPEESPIKLDAENEIEKYATEKAKSYIKWRNMENKNA